VTFVFELEGAAFRWPPVVDGVLRQPGPEAGALASGPRWIPLSSLPRA
jgi:hypothetical protein